MQTRFVRLLVALLALALIAGACGDDDTADAVSSGASAEESRTVNDQPTEPEAPGTVVDVAAANGSFTTLVAAVQAAGLVDTLSGEGPFTVLAPTDDAFATALDALGLSPDELLADTALLTSVLTYHVIPGEVPSSKVVTLDGQPVTTVNGADVAITVDGDTVMVNDATVTAVDIAASNGVIHVIDTVLLPPS
jgi:uncharacterized surface protein with fasciclin (FAS1) repeats